MQTGSKLIRNSKSKPPFWQLMGMTGMAPISTHGNGTNSCLPANGIESLMGMIGNNLIHFAMKHYHITSLPANGTNSCSTNIKSIISQRSKHMQVEPTHAHLYSLPVTPIKFPTSPRNWIQFKYNYKSTDPSFKQIKHNRLVIIR